MKTKRKARRSKRRAESSTSTASSSEIAAASVDDSPKIALVSGGKNEGAEAESEKISKKKKRKRSKEAEVQPVVKMEERFANAANGKKMRKENESKAESSGHGGMLRDDEESSDASSEVLIDFDENELRRKFGLKPVVREDEIEFDTTEDISARGKEKDIKDDLRCSMCLHTLYKPVSLSCGHSFCRLCLAHALKHLKTEWTARFHCPQCRAIACRKCSLRFQVNKVLWGVILKLFPNLPEKRRESEEVREFTRAFSEATGVDLDGGTFKNALIRRDQFQILQECHFARTVTRNEQDLVMRLAMSLMADTDPVPFPLRTGNLTENVLKQWIIGVALLELEEDEDENCQGFPGMILSEHPEDKALMRRAFDGGVSCGISVEEVGASTFRKILDIEGDFQDGQVIFEIDRSRLPTEFTRVKVVIESKQHEALRCSFEITCNLSAENVNYLKRSFRPPPLRNGEEVGSDGEAGFDIQHSDDESEDEELNDFEEDGFIVDDGDSVVYQSSDSERREVVIVPGRTNKNGKQLKRHRTRSASTLDSSVASDLDLPSTTTKVANRKRKVLDSDDSDEESSADGNCQLESSITTIESKKLKHKKEICEKAEEKDSEEQQDKRRKKKKKSKEKKKKKDKKKKTKERNVSKNLRNNDDNNDDDEDDENESGGVQGDSADESAKYFHSQFSYLNDILVDDSD